MAGIRKLVLSGNDGTIGTFHPNKTTIKENDLECKRNLIELRNPFKWLVLVLEKSLDNLDDGAPRKKRQMNNDYGYMDDEVADAANDAQSADARLNYEVKSSMDSVQVPMKGGSPAFSIHADKVYILYPSLFQDPNIFGRFSIPQTINLDPIPDKSISKTKEAPQKQNLHPIHPMHPQLGHRPQMAFDEHIDSNLPYGERKIAKRETTDPAPTQKVSSSSKKEAEKKRNIETHLSGTIVVLNQDVNEINRKDSY